MKNAIVIASIIIVFLATWFITLNCASTKVGDLSFESTTEAAPTTTVVATTTTTAGATSTSTSTSTSFFTGTGPSTTTTISQSNTVSGTIYKNECTASWVTVHINADNMVTGDLVGSPETFYFTGGTAHYSITMDQARPFVVVALVGDKPPLFIGGVGVTTGDAAVAMTQFKLYTCLAGIVTSESGQDFNMYTFIDSKKKP